MQSIFDKITLNNGYQMPRLGAGPDLPDVEQTYGAWNVNQTEEEEHPGALSFRRTLDTMIECGFRSFDSSARYGTEAPLGDYFRTCGIPREELFLTTKVNNLMHGYDNTMRDFEQSMKNTGLDYIDLYLIHCPVPIRGLYVQTWKALEEIYRSGRVRAIGVSNFTVQHFYDLADVSDIVPAVNQYEQHPFYVQANLLAYERRHGIVPQSYSPLGQGKFARDPRIQWLADKYGKTIAQIILRWHLQMGFMVVTRSSNETRIRQNADLFDFALSDEDMGFMAALNHGDRIWHDPDRFPGTAAHIQVETAFREAARRAMERADLTAGQLAAAEQALEALLEPADVDGTRDYIIYCFNKAAAIYGRNGNIAEQAAEQAELLAEAFVENFRREAKE